MAEVKELVEEVWVEGSQMEGDITVHEYGNNRTRNSYRGGDILRSLKNVEGEGNRLQ